MKLKYYLRGLGIGMAVTALILAITAKPETLSDDQIRTRAKQLGMIDAGDQVLSNLKPSADDAGNTVSVDEENASASESVGNNNAESESPESSAAESESPESSAAESESPESSAAESESPESIPAESESVEGSSSESEESVASTEQETTESTPVTINIKSGAGSYSVAKLLAEAGLIEDAREFDNYLCDSGYSKSIRVGSYSITPGSTEEEIAKIITGKR